MRTSKTVNGVKHTYTLDGTKILREAWGNNTLIPLYDFEDSVCGIIYNGVPYYFLKNLQGDIIAIVDKDADLIAKYTYDAWGKVLSVTDKDGNLITDTSHIAHINPFRYRGYYFDNEIGLYYLQSRYYDPITGRFVNADEAVFAIVGQNVLQNNLFAYCFNNAITCSDHTGYWGILAAVAETLIAYALVAAFLLLCVSLLALIKMIPNSEFQNSWYYFCTDVGNGLSWMSENIRKGGKAAWNWTKSQVKSATNALSDYISFAKADANIRTKIKRHSKSRYWIANCYNIGGFKYAIITTPISFTKAKSLASTGQSIFSVTKSEARTLAKRFPGVSGPERGEPRKCCRQYWHYHILNKKFKNQHIFYLYQEG